MVRFEMSFRLRYRSLVANACGNTLAVVAAIAVSFFMAPVVLRALGDARYGAWSFAESFLAYLTLFDLGVAAAIVRFVPKFRVSDDFAALNRLFSTCLAFFTAAAGCAVVLGLGFYLVALDWFLNVPAD